VARSNATTGYPIHFATEKVSGHRPGSADLPHNSCFREQCEHSRLRERQSSSASGWSPRGDRTSHLVKESPGRRFRVLLVARMAPPQAFISSYAPRIRAYGNSLLIPVLPPAASLGPPGSRTTKRGTTIINYAEDGYGEEDEFSGPDGPRRPTGLRSLRRDETNVDRSVIVDKLHRELKQPVELQGIWREWMGRPKHGR
jgi:hypothetical protein